MVLKGSVHKNHSVYYTLFPSHDQGFRLAPSYISSKEVKYARKLLRSIGKDVQWWLEATGYSKLNDFYELNPLIPCWIMQGIIIETYLGEME